MDKFKITISLLFVLLLIASLAIFTYIMIGQNKLSQTSLTLQEKTSQLNIKLDQIQSQFDSFKTSYKQDILTMLDKNCGIWSVANPTGKREVTGDDICSERGAGTCILMVNYDRLASNDLIQRCTPYVTGKDDKMVAYCCRP